jgi:hypothetical protein
MLIAQVTLTCSDACANYARGYCFIKEYNITYGGILFNCFYLIFWKIYYTVSR